MKLANQIAKEVEDNFDALYSWSSSHLTFLQAQNHQIFKNTI